MTLNLIVAVGKNLEIGKNNDLLFNLPNDLQYFKSVTFGKTVIMGRNTFFSLPKMLPGRKHIVLTLEQDEYPSEVEVFYNLEDFLNKYRSIDEEIFVIGGGMIYKLLLPYCDKLYITEVNALDGEADTFFPSFDKSEYKRTVLGNNSDGSYTYEHVLYEKK